MYLTVAIVFHNTKNGILNYFLCCNPGVPLLSSIIYAILRTLYANERYALIVKLLLGNNMLY